MCTVLCGLDTLGDLVIYARNKKEFLTKEFGIEEIPSKATFARVLEAVPIAEVRRLASKFFDCRCQKSAGIRYVFQGFLAKAGGKFAVKMRAAAIGTAS